MDESYVSIARDQTEGHKALLELESKFNKKSRSAALSIQGSQIQALTGFIRIFELYPYPVVINAAILKLADWFRTYNNNVKYYVYKVFKEASDLHLSKVINIEETVRRILPILGSNDTIARSITLRVLGCMSMIIAEKLDVQFGIIQRLELATDRIELEAAIWAGDQICARSARFSSVIFPKVADKLEKMDTPLDIKLRAVKIFRHMHTDIGMARQANLACLSLLGDSETNTKLVIVTLRTLTLLLSKVVIDRREQIDRLLDYAMKDKREDIRYNVLYDLYILGKNDIMFDETHVIRLLQVITSNGAIRTQQRAFHCGQRLFVTHQKLIVHLASTNSSISREFMQQIDQCEQIMKSTITRKQYSLFIACARFLFTISQIALSPFNNNDMMDTDIQTLTKIKDMAYRVAGEITKVDLSLINQGSDLKQINKLKSKELLKVKVSFCFLLEDWDCDASFEEAYGLLKMADDGIVTVLLPYLTTLSKKCTKLSTWFPNAAMEELKRRLDQPLIYVNLIRLLLRTTPSSHELTQMLSTLLKEFGSWDDSIQSYRNNGWNIYVIGIEAGTCGWYELMYTAMEGLCKKAETEKCFYWLSSLSSLAHAEWTLSKQKVANTTHTSSTSNLFLKSITQLKALQSLDRSRKIQLWFVQLRMEMLANIQRTLTVIDIPQLAKQSKFMIDCAIQFRKMASRYDFLSQAQFGVGKQMLDTIESYKICALVCEHLARVFSATDQAFFCIDPSLIPLLQENHTVIKRTNRNQSAHLISLCRGFVKKANEWEELDHLEEEDRRMACKEDLKLILDNIMSEPLMLPKSFFEYRKNISVQLATEPSISEQSPVTLQSNEDLVIKFEGLVQVDQRVKQLEKKIKKAVIVCFVTTEKIIHLDDKLNVSMMFSDPAQALTSSGHQSILLQPPTIYIANVRKSYFTYTGLLRLPKTKRASPQMKREAWVNISVKLLDSDSGIWVVGSQQWGKVIW